MCEPALEPLLEGNVDDGIVKPAVHVQHIAHEQRACARLRMSEMVVFESHIAHTQVYDADVLVQLIIEVVTLCLVEEDGQRVGQFLGIAGVVLSAVGDA